jgi:mannose-6-phosphate isomerase-like protein (cupin superfamily)
MLSPMTDAQPIRRVLACLAFAFAVVSQAQNAPPSALRYWSADDLKSGDARLLLTTPTHILKLIRVADAPLAESHEGTTDVFFVESGAGTILVGGEMEGANPLPDMPGELRGRSIKGGNSYELKPFAMINIPPSTPYIFQKGPTGLTLVQLRINVGMHPWSLVSTQQTGLAGTPGRPREAVALDPDQDPVVYWSAETLEHAHEAMAKTAAAGGSVADPRALVSIPITRTHAYNFLHRIMGKNGQPPGVEFHQGNTDIYFVIGGSETLMTGGEIENREHIPNRPGEDRGPLIKNGKGYRMKPGDVVNMPPLVPHQSLPDPGGFTYMLIKVNTGTYPWSLTEK